MNGGITAKEAQAFYDRLGKFQELEKWYEIPAFQVLFSYGVFQEAEYIFELGCGTGEFAKRLFENYISEKAYYYGVDVSSVMVELTKEKLSPWKDRVQVQQVSGEPEYALVSDSIDCFIATYVFDLMDESLAQDYLKEAHRLLKPNGYLCLISLTHGKTTIGKLISSLWGKIQSYKPEKVGGCRPVDLLNWIHLASPSWMVEHHETIQKLGVTSEVLIAKPLKNT